MTSSQAQAAFLVAAYVDGTLPLRLYGKAMVGLAALAEEPGAALGFLALVPLAYFGSLILEDMAGSSDFQSVCHILALSLEVKNPGMPV